MKITALLLMSAATLAGCTLAPDYTRPNLPTASGWKIDEKQAALLSDEAQEAAAQISWQSFFQSEGMRSAIETALANNRDLRIAAINVEAARALYRIERADLMPSVDAQVSGSRQKVTESESGSNPLFNARREFINSTYTANVASTAFELDLFGKIQSQNEAALEEYFASQSARDALQIALIAETANAYLQWQADRKILALTDDTLLAQEKSLTLIQKRFDNGIGSKLDVAQLRQAIESARANQARYKRYVQQDENALVLLLGTQSLDESLQKQQLNDVSVMKKLPVGLPSDVLTLRPDVMQAEHQLRAANATIGAARAAFFPTLSLTGSYGFASSDLNHLFSGAAAGAWSFMPQITLPIFQGGRNAANLDYAKLVKEASVANYEKTLQIAFREVADELAAYGSLHDELAAQRQLVAASQEAYDLSYARYKEGIDNFLNVLDAQRSLFASQQQLIDVDRQSFANLVNLYKALGGGLKSQ